MRFLFYNLLIVTLLFTSCKKDENTTPEPTINEDASTFKEIATISIGGIGAAEISAYDASTKKLFVVNNSSTNRIEIIDLTDPAMPKIIGNINLVPYNGASNSVACYNGKLAVALESTTSKQDLGKVVVFNTSTYAEIKQITVGALPDMVTFSPDGNFILTANEGEPNDTYTNDPDGTVSIIDVNNNYTATTLNFSAFNTQLTTLKQAGFRSFGPSAGNLAKDIEPEYITISTDSKTAWVTFIDVNNNYTATTLNFSAFNTQLTTLKQAGFRSFGPSAGNLAKDIEPEYITISTDSKTAWVTLQENNAIAKIDLTNKTITTIFPLGFKDYNVTENAIDISDQDGGIAFANWKVKGMFEPDAISYFENNGTQYVVTANEGDQREYTGFNEVKRIGSSSVLLDATAFPNAVTLKTNAQMGRLNITTTLGDTDGDGDLDELYSYGSRSFSIWNGTTGQLVFDSKNDLDKRAQTLTTYDDGRSDDKGSEPEAVITGKMGTKNILFVGLERADAFVIYDISNPIAPQFLQSLKTGDAPEGILFIPAKNAPTNRSLLILSNENDGTIRIYQPNLL